MHSKLSSVIASLFWCVAACSPKSEPFVDQTTDATSSTSASTSATSSTFVPPTTSSGQGNTTPTNVVPPQPTSEPASSAAPSEPELDATSQAISLSEALTGDGESSRDDVTASSAGGSPTTDSAALVPTKVFVAGDSTVATYRDTASPTDQAGWGQMLHERLLELAVVDNRAVGGTTARSFIDFGHFDKIAQDIAAGDTLLVQFGTNDGNKSAKYDHNGQQIPYYLDPATDYKFYLAKYIELAETKGAHLVFVTPPPRNSAYCTGGNGTGAHAQAMRELATERGIALSDLNQRSVDYLKAICPAPTPEDFFALRADGSVDGTHFQENGARILARLVAEGIADSGAPLGAYVVAP